MITELPKNWQEKTIRSVCEPTRLWNPQREQRDKFWYVDVSAISRAAFAIREPQQVIAEQAPSRARKIIQTNDTIFATVRPTLRRVAFVGKQFDNQIASTAFCVVRANKQQAVPRFLYYVLLTDFLNEEIAKFESGASYPAVNDKDVLDRNIPLPPKSEQEKIAAVLWKVQRGVGVQDKLTAIAGELKRSIMHQLFTHGLRNEIQKETEIGLLPESWDVVSLGSLGHIGNGSTPKRTNLAYWQKGHFPWLTSGKIYEGVIEKADQFVTESALQECHLPIVKAGSVLIAITGYGTPGNAAIVTFDTCISQHLAYLQFERKDVEPDFVRHFIQSRHTELHSIAQSGGSTKGALTCGFLKQYAIPLPTLIEQRQIASILRSIDLKIAVHERKRAALEELFKTLLHQLMTGQIRVANLDIDVSEIQS
jgi:type I restriction enzyme, S subunit